jgi:hypothetical protein
LSIGFHGTEFKAEERDQHALLARLMRKNLGHCAISAGAMGPEHIPARI